MVLELQDELTTILREKNDKIAQLIKRAIKNQVNVDILVTSADGEDMAWKYFKALGYPQGACEFTHVYPQLASYVFTNHLSISFNTILAS